MTIEEAIDELSLYAELDEIDKRIRAALNMAISALRAQQAAEKNKPRGLYGKYIVRKSDTGELVESCFVLRPEKDVAAVEALRAYAGATDNETLAADIINWIGAEKNDPLTLEELRGMDCPVWICYKQETWGPQHPLADNMSCSRYKFSFEDYGKTWLAYRRPPTEKG